MIDVKQIKNPTKEYRAKPFWSLNGKLKKEELDQFINNNDIEFNNYIIRLKETYQFSFISGITSNGYLLNLENFKRLYAVGVENYQITLDGWKHDIFRQHINGEKTLNKIIDNLQQISQLPKEYEFVIRLRYNISENNQDTSWYDYIKEHFGLDDRFSMYINFVKDWGGESVKSVELCTTQKMEDLEKEHVLYMEKIGLKNNNSVNENLIPLKNVCYAAYPNSYVFMPNDDILKCTVALEEEENKIGKIDKNEGVVLNSEKEAVWIKTTLEYCEGCKHILSCLHRACPRQVVINKQPIYECMLHH